ncbi:helix-turn-helix domain-containing protein [Nocardia altamirensis]|uniref:helix-turn-helix domain-containing protein n=1 Tax=Nocardia altamirensis TaxID=472158 RepID=UPI0008401059|nr:helix-turn-helix transcriptional regulator [Nocardia altamirensis]
MVAQPVRIKGVDPTVADRGPTALRIAVGGQLRRLREAAGITRDDAGEHIRSSHAKISRLELGRHGFKDRDVRDLLTLYGVTDSDQREMFLELARKANEPGWWHRYNDLLPHWFETYIGLEGAAHTIRTFEGQLVPGLLQTEDYTRAVVAVRHKSPDSVRRVELRRKRQEILDRPAPPKLWAVLDEAVLHRPIGSIAVLRAQIEHLTRMTDRPNVTIQVLPYRTGGHPAAGSSFTMLRFAERELPDIVYMEQLASAIYLDRRDEVGRYHEVMDQLAVQAAPPAETNSLLHEAAAAL